MQKEALMIIVAFLFLVSITSGQPIDPVDQEIFESFSCGDVNKNGCDDCIEKLEETTKETLCLKSQISHTPKNNLYRMTLFEILTQTDILTKIKNKINLFFQQETINLGGSACGDPADFSCDGKVNYLDLELLETEWFNQTNQPGYVLNDTFDIDGSGEINETDVILMQPTYQPFYDLNQDGVVNETDRDVLIPIQGKNLEDFDGYLAIADLNVNARIDPLDLNALNQEIAAQQAVCGNGIQEAGEECDDGMHCEDDSSCTQNSECTGIGDGLCLPRDNFGCDASCNNLQTQANPSNITQLQYANEIVHQARKTEIPLSFNTLESSNALQRPDGSIRITQDNALASFNPSQATNGYLWLVLDSYAYDSGFLRIMKNNNEITTIPLNKTYLEINTNTPPITGNAFTIAMRTNLTSFGSTLFSSLSGSTRYPRATVDFDPAYKGTLFLELRNGQTLHGREFISDKEEHHLVFTYDDQTGIAAIYVDGKRDIQQNFGALSIGSGTTNPRIGYSHEDNSYGFDGSIQELKVFDAALSENDIINLYNQNPITPQPTLDLAISDWCSGTLQDLSGNYGSINRINPESCPSTDKTFSPFREAMYLLNTSDSFTQSDDIQIEFNNLNSESTDNDKHPVRRIYLTTEKPQTQSLRIETLNTTFTTSGEAIISWKTNQYSDARLEIGATEIFSDPIKKLHHSFTIPSQFNSGQHTLTATSCNDLGECDIDTDAIDLDTKLNENFNEIYGEVILNIIGDFKGETNVPVSTGFPFPDKTLKNINHLAIRDAENNQFIPAQFKVNALWPSGAIKWVQIDLIAQNGKEYKLEYGRNPQFSPQNPFTITQDTNTLTINNGVLEATLNKNTYSFIETLKIDLDKNDQTPLDTIFSSNQGGLFLYDKNSQEFSSNNGPATIIVEETGPIRTTILINGSFYNQSSNQYMLQQTRLHFYADKKSIQSEISLELTEEGEPTFVTPQVTVPMNHLKKLELQLPIAQNPGTVTTPILSETYSNADQFTMMQRHSFASENLTNGPVFSTENATAFAIFDTPPLNPVDGGSFSITLNATINSLDETNVIFSRLSGQSLYPRLRIETDGRIRFMFRHSGNSVTRNVWTSALDPVQPGVSTTIGVRYNKATGEGSVFKDGVEYSESEGTGDLETGIFEAIIGRDFESRNELNGYIEDLKIYNTALTDNQMQGIAQPPAPDHEYAFGLAGLNKSVALDLSGNANNAHIFIDGENKGHFLVDNGNYNYLIAMNGFWQRHPKSFEVSENQIILGLLPELETNAYDTLDEITRSRKYFWFDNGNYKLRQGLRTTNEILIDFDTANWQAKADLLENYLAIYANPSWYENTQALGEISGIANAEQIFSDYEQFVETGYDLLEENRKWEFEYGFMSYGDWYGERSFNWGNSEYDLPWTLMLDFLRKGDIKKLYRADQAAWHISDISVIHHGKTIDKSQFTWSDEPAKNHPWKHSVGHTGGYDDPTWPQISSTTLFVRGTGDFGHLWTRGLLTAGMLKGNNRYIRDGIALADTTIGLAEYRIPVWRYAERTIGWPLIALMGAYQTTGDNKYLSAAKVMNDHAIWIQDNQRGNWPYWLQNCGGGTYDHHGGASFMTGVLLHGLHIYDLANPEPETKQAIIQGAEHIMNDLYIPSENGIAHLFCPLFVNSDPDPRGDNPHVLDAVAYAYTLQPASFNLAEIQSIWQFGTEDYSGFTGKSFASNSYSVPYAIDSMVDILNTCTIKNAYWSNTSTGKTILTRTNTTENSWLITETQNCNSGENLNLLVYQTDGTLATNQPGTIAVHPSQTSATNWNAAQENILTQEQFNFNATIQGNFESTKSNTLTISDFLENICGNSLTETGEECDNGPSNNNNNSCTLSCSNAFCGDGLVWNQDGGTEECDDANSDNTDACNSCILTSCGDNIVQNPNGQGGTEECDGNTQVCSINGYSGTQSCSLSCTFNTCTTTEFCGDGIINGPETCDDQNTNNGDGCSSTCQVENGWTCNGEPSTCLFDCLLTDAYWNQTTAVQGDRVELIIEGTQCDGEELNFTIFEDDGALPDDPATTLPANALFSGNQATAIWSAEWQDDQLTDPEWYFIATTIRNPQQTISSGTLSAELLVVQPRICSTNADCSDGLFCTQDVCTNNICSNPPVAVSTCDDGLGCTIDVCNETLSQQQGQITCEITPDDTFCDDGLFCNGAETCDMINGCVAGTLPVIDDGASCTTDSCNETLDMVIHATNDSLCGNGFICLPFADCVPIIPDYTPFDGATTNFTNVNDITNVTGALIENTTFGLINFTNNSINFAGLNLTENIQFNNAVIAINTSGPGIERLNVSSILHFYGINFIDPEIRRDGAVCPECTELSYTNSEFIVSVPGFSTYTVVEVGSSNNDGGGSGSSGGGGGGGISAPSAASATCTERWICTSWTECFDGTQERECRDENGCGSDQERPLDFRECRLAVETQTTTTPQETIQQISKSYSYILLLAAIIIITIVLAISSLFKHRNKKRRTFENNYAEIYEPINLAKKAKTKEDKSYYYKKIRAQFEARKSLIPQKDAKKIRNEILKLYNQIK